MADPQVAVFVGSEHDLGVAAKTTAILDRLQIPFSLNVASAHRHPHHLEALVNRSPAKVLIGIAGASAGLPGALAALTTRPVIGVPVAGPFAQDALVGMVQMPAGVPVATVGVDAGENAGLLAAAMLAMGDERVQGALVGHREAQREALVAADERVQTEAHGRP